MPENGSGFTGANSNYKDQKLPIGYYASGNLEVPELPVEKFEAPTVKLVNDEYFICGNRGSE